MLFTVGFTIIYLILRTKDSICFTTRSGIKIHSYYVFMNMKRKKLNIESEKMNKQVWEIRKKKRDMM